MEKKDKKIEVEKAREYRATYRKRYPDRVISSQTKYLQTKNGKEVKARAEKAYSERSPEKIKARNALKQSIISNRTERPSQCERCGSEGKTHGHHEDYSKALEVIWLCPQHHADRHRELRKLITTPQGK